MRRISLLEIERLLPKTNCGECGEIACMGFASKLIEREAKLEECPPIWKDSKYKAKKSRLIELLRPPVREVEVGVGKNAVKIGGKEVLYRHELKFHDPTAIAIDVWDTMEEEKLVERCKAIESYQVEKLGRVYTLDMIAVRSASGNPETFRKAVSAASNATKYPIILCSKDSAVLRAGLSEISDKKPLIYSATEENWREVGKLAKDTGCPVVASAYHDALKLKSLVRGLKKFGISDIVLEPGVGASGVALAETLSHFTMLRKSVIKGGDKDLGYPLLGVPVVAHLEGEKYVAKTFREAYVATMLIARFADALILHSLEPWSLLGIINFRLGIYQDPNEPAFVDPGYKVIGSPTEVDPVILTSNFALTANMVEADVSKVPCHLLIVDTEGYSVDTSVAADKLTASKVKELMKSTKIGEKVKHKKIIIPGKAARLRGEIEDATGWEVVVGPQDSSELAGFIQEKWEGIRAKA